MSGYKQLKTPVKRGDTWTFKYMWKSNNKPIDLTSCSARSQVRLRRVGTLVSSISSPNGINIDELNGVVTVIFPASDTLNAEPGTYETDLEITFSDNTIQSSDTIEFRVYEDITRD